MKVIKYIIFCPMKVALHCNFPIFSLPNLYITISSTPQLSFLGAVLAFAPLFHHHFWAKFLSMFSYQFPQYPILLSLSTPNLNEFPSHFYCKFSLFKHQQQQLLFLVSLYIFFFSISWLYSDKFHSSRTNLVN